jgi:hypothetical protein
MSRKTMFLVRGEDGRMRTIMAVSHRQAARIYADRYAVGDGEEIDVKERGAGPCWERFRVG